jgi:hypothetical protein
MPDVQNGYWRLPKISFFSARARRWRKHFASQRKGGGTKSGDCRTSFILPLYAPAIPQASTLLVATEPRLGMVGILETRH